MKTGLLKIIYPNLFIRLDHEDRYIHLTQIYELSSTLGTLETKEEGVFMSLFPLIDWKSK